jgi:class 3 adenylate cyclase
MPGLAMRVGITTAEVAVSIGATGQGMVAGDAVNTAARIQSTAPPGEVWVDETTRVFTTSAIAFEDAGSHSMKGKAEPVPLWAVRAVVAGAGGERRDDGLEAPLIGRDRELRLVKEVFHRVQETLRPGLLVVDGEPGVGKSRLGWEFEKYVDGLDAQVLWHNGRCLSYGEGVAYYALAEAVRGRIAVLADADAEELDSRQLLQRALVACVPEQTERDWLEPRLAALLGAESGGSFPREDLFVAWSAFFKYVGLKDADASAPEATVLVIDDAQYADDGLMAFLEHLLAAADYPVFVLVLSRPELLADHPALASNRRVTVVHLEPLAAPEMTRLLDGLVAGVPDSLRAALVERAEGIPLYAIETVRSLVDQELVVASNGRYLLSDPDAVDLAALSAPTTLQALIAARLDTLPADERTVVDRASVLGLVFTDLGIKALCADVADLDSAIAGLFRREVLRHETDRLSADFGSYRFVQGAVRQVAYGMLSRRERKSTHLTVAGALEAELEARSDAYELAPIIAQHYLDAIDAVPADADVPELTRAVSDHLERAADRAAALGAPGEAARHLQMALSRCDADRRLRIESKLARQLRITGDYTEAIEHAAAALKGFEAEGDFLATAAPAEDLALALVYSEGDLDRAEAVVREQLARLPDTRQSLGARMALVTALAAVVLRQNNHEELRRAGEESMHLAEISGDPRQIADSWITHSLSAHNDGLPRLAVSLLERAAELAGEHRALHVRGVALVNLAGYSSFENLALSVRTGREAVDAAREIGDVYMAVFAEGNLASALLLTGEWSESLNLASGDAVRTHMPTESRIVRRLMTSARGDAWTEAPDFEAEDEQSWQPSVDTDRAFEALVTGSADAAALATAGVERARRDATVNEFWLSWLFATEIALSLGDRHARSELLAYVEDQTHPWPASLRTQRARLRALVGSDGSPDAGSVEDSFEEAIETATAWGSTLFEAHARADYGAWLVREGRAEEGAGLLAHAREFYEGIGARRWLEGLDRAR